MEHFFLKTISLFLLVTFQTGCKNQSAVELDDDGRVIINEPALSNPIDLHEDPGTLVSTDPTDLKYWDWKHISIPAYNWPAGTAFGDGLFVDSAFDSQGITIQDGKMRFYVDPLLPHPPTNAPSTFNYRSEIHTSPWNIDHPLGTEQWIGWTYTFGNDYVIDSTSPITIFQNHPGINGLSPQIELELAALNDPAPALGGEIQVVNEAASDRIVLPVKPLAGDSLDIVIHVIYGLEEAGLLQVWLNGVLYYNQITSTVYEDYPWGGNNKWGVYHHTFNNSEADVQSSMDTGAGRMELFMGPLRMITRSPDHPQYNTNAYNLVMPNN